MQVGNLGFLSHGSRPPNQIGLALKAKIALAGSWKLRGVRVGVIVKKGSLGRKEKVRSWLRCATVGYFFVILEPFIDLGSIPPPTIPPF